MRDYWIDLTAYEHVRTIKVEAESPEEAIRKACERANISVKIVDASGLPAGSTTADKQVALASMPKVPA